MIERCFGSIKYEHLYLHEIDDGPALAEEVSATKTSTTAAPARNDRLRLPIDRYLTGLDNTPTPHSQRARLSQFLTRDTPQEEPE